MGRADTFYYFSGNSFSLSFVRSVFSYKKQSEEPMFLRSMEMFGFKSFADRTQVEFEPGITCIVGPNGCGKSNVVDAIKWVLGKAGPKHPRRDSWRTSFSPEPNIASRSLLPKCR